MFARHLGVAAECVEENAEIFVGGPGCAADEQFNAAVGEGGEVLCEEGVALEEGETVVVREGLEDVGWAVVEGFDGSWRFETVAEDGGHYVGDGDVCCSKPGASELVLLGEANEGVGVGEFECEDGEAEVVPIYHEFGVAEAADESGDEEGWY